MERQEIIRILKQYRSLHVECERIRRRIIEKRDGMYDVQSVVMGGANVRSGDIADKVEQAVESMNCLVEHYTSRIIEASDAESRIAEMIDSISDSEERAVLFMHYIEGKTFAEISEKIFLSERTVWYRHNSAVNRLCAATPE